MNVERALQRSLDVVVTLCIIAVTGAILITLYTKTTRHLPTASTPHIEVGDRLDLSDEHWNAFGQTIVIAVRTGCHYCTDSLPLYSSISSRLSRLKSTRLLAISPDDPKETKSYLSLNRVEPFAIHQVNLQKLGIPGTPTIIIMDSSGRVKRIWIGKLRKDQEDEVLQAIGLKVQS